MSDPYRKRKTLKLSKQKNIARNEQWRKFVLGHLERHRSKISKLDGKKMEALLGLRAYAGPIRASDLAATQKFGELCIRIVHTFQMAVTSLRWFSITLLTNELNVSERSPLVTLKRLKGKAYKEIQELGLNALIWIDAHPLTNWPQAGKGATFMFHVHALAFTEEKFDVKAARKKLAASKSWSCELGSKPTQITEITPQMGVAAWWAGYGAKPPNHAKILRIDKKTGKQKLMNTTSGYRPQLAMRLIEGFAHLDIMQMVFSVGEAKDLRDEIRRELIRWHRKRWPDQKKLKTFDVWPVFKRLWAATKVRKYRRWRIIGSLL